MIFTKREAKFFNLLREATKDRYLIFPQVPLRLILDITCDEQRAFNDIAHKTPDFILADPTTLETVLVIELDDQTHNLIGRRVRDHSVESGLSTAKVPLLRVLRLPADAASLRREIANALQAKRI